MKKYLFLVGLIMIMAAPRERKLFIAGDSTAQTYDTAKTLQRGWGQLIQTYLSPDIVVDNRAIGGRSTKTFIYEGRWQKIVDNIAQGDIVAIQFGHNDASTRPERHASYEEYRHNLQTMVADVRNKGAQPVLLTSVVMRTFKEGNLIDDRLKAYPAITRQVARELNVKLIDVNVMMRDTVLLLGNEASKELYMWIEAGTDSTYKDGKQDDTHLKQNGANAVARFIANQLIEK